MHRKKGSAAMEFLMTYGWAVLAVLVAIGALGYYAPQWFYVERCVIGPGFYCDDIAAEVNPAADDGVSDWNHVRYRIKNLMGEDISEIYINASRDGNNFCTVKGSDFNPIETSLRDGQTLTVISECYYDPSGAGKARLKDRIDLDFTVTYRTAIQNYNHTTRGEVQVPVSFRPPENYMYVGE